MSDQKNRMLAGALYDPADAQLVAERVRARQLCQRYNALPAEGQAERAALLAQLLGTVGRNAVIQPPFFCDYGSNITLGDAVFFNFNCVVLDVARVTIGHRSLFGPAVQIYGATHPMDAATRARGLELGAPIAVGDDCWIGGGAILCPGITIGDGTVVGAGSVVTRSLPAGVFAAGNPCRVLRTLG